MGERFHGMQEVVGSIPSGSTRISPAPRTVRDPRLSASFPVRFHIQANFPLTLVPTVPEIVIHKSGARSGLRRLAERDGDAGLVPYWASWWGGGVGLARHLLDHPDIAEIGR